MATCSSCKKNIGFFSRHYHCLYCGKSLCGECIKETTPPEQISYVLRLADDPHAGDILSSSFISTRKDVACASCFRDKYLPRLNELQRAIDTSESVELVSKSYKGRKPISGDGIEISSLWHSDWDNCDYDLKVLARLNDCDIVMNVDKERDVETWEEEKDNGKGTYTRSRTIWQKTGIAYKRAKRTKNTRN